MPKLCRDLPGWEVVKGYWRLVGKCPKSIGDLHSNLYEERIHFGKCPNRSGDPLGAFPSMSPANRKQGYPLRQLPTVSPNIPDMFCFFLWSTTVLLNLIKNQRHNRKVNNYQWFFSNFFSFQPYHYCSNSNFRDSPFKGTRTF
jgi:hypothetical protein